MIDRKSGSAGMPRPSSYAVFCLKKKTGGAGLRTGTLVIADNATGSPQSISLTGTGLSTGGSISAVWANEGGDKVAQDELRASHRTENLTGKVVNRVWDGTKINLAGAHNEV